MRFFFPAPLPHQPVIISDAGNVIYLVKVVIVKVCRLDKPFLYRREYNAVAFMKNVVGSNFWKTGDCRDTP